MHKVNFEKTNDGSPYLIGNRRRATLIINPRMVVVRLGFGFTPEESSLAFTRPVLFGGQFIRGGSARLW